MSLDQKRIPLTQGDPELEEGGSSNAICNPELTLNMAIDDKSRDKTQVEAKNSDPETGGVFV